MTKFATRHVLLLASLCLLSCESLFEKSLGLMMAFDSDDNRARWSQTWKIYSPSGLLRNRNAEKGITSIFGHVEKRPDGSLCMAEAQDIEVQLQNASSLPDRLVVLRGIKTTHGNRVLLKHCIWFDPYSRDVGTSFPANAIKMIQRKHLDSYSLNDWSVDQHRSKKGQR